jgi:hypothetical protein
VRRPRLRRRGRRRAPAGALTSSCLTAAEPNLDYFERLIGRLDVAIEEVTDRWGVLAVQGPRARSLLEALTPDVETLSYFGLTPTKIGKVPVTVSRTGYTGDLGYELWIPAGEALKVWDAVWETSRGQGVIPIGMTALYMARIEAGLVLLDVDFHSARFAWTDADKTTPFELGLGWMLRNPGRGRPCVHRPRRDRARARHEVVALEAERAGRRLEGLRPHLQRGRADPAQGPHADPGRVLRLLTTSSTSSATRRARCTRRCSSATSPCAACPLDRISTRITGQARARGQPPLRVLRRARSPGTPSSTPSEGPPDMPKTANARPRPRLAPPARRANLEGRPHLLTRSSSAADITADERLRTWRRPGLRTLVLERRHLGRRRRDHRGAAPGFWFTTFSYALSLLRPDIVQDLELVKHGFMPILMPTTFCPKEDGDYLLMGQDHGENQKEIARHSAHDADAYDAVQPRRQARSCQAIKPLLDQVPPDIFSDDPEELIALAALGQRFKRLDKKVLHDAGPAC